MVDYLIDHGEVKIVDEFTGRVLEGRRYSEGLHQAIEAKEGVAIKEENQTLATITLQNYFRLYDKLSGMTGTAKTEAAEFAQIYGLRWSRSPPTARWCGSTSPTWSTRPRTPSSRRWCRTSSSGTSAASRCWSGRSRSRSRSSSPRSCSTSGGYRTRSSTPSSTPGRPRSSPRPVGVAAVTVATNMAGRGVDIKLGGNPEGMARTELKRRGITHDRPRLRGAGAKADPGVRVEIDPDKQRVIDAGRSTWSAPSGTSHAASTTSSEGRSGRQGDPASPASTCRWATT